MKIAFGYKAGSGKDTCVDFLIKKYGGYKLAFSDPIYDILHYAQKICNIEQGKDRGFLQYIGTEWGRNKDPDMWTKLLISKVPRDGNCYISDLRFPNELEMLKDNRWVCIKINRVIQNNREGTGSLQHSSENVLDDISDKEWDFVINNNGSLEDLFSKVEDIMNNIL